MDFKYIYILYSNTSKSAYIGSTTLNLKRRLCFHLNDSKKPHFTLTSKEIMKQDDYKIDYIYKFSKDDIENHSLLEIEHNIIKKYYYKNEENNNLSFKNNLYKIVNKRLPYTNKRYLCECCNKYLTKRIIEKHKTNININM